MTSHSTEPGVSDVTELPATSRPERPDGAPIFAAPGPPEPVDITPDPDGAPPAAVIERRCVRRRLRDTPLRLLLVIASVLALLLALAGVLSVSLYEVRHQLRDTVDQQLMTAQSAAESQVHPFET